MKRRKYKSGGWYGEPHRHYLAAKGIKTKYDNRYFKFVKDTTIPAVEDPGTYRSNIETRKVLLSPDEVLDLIYAAGADPKILPEWNETRTREAIEGHEQGKAIHAAVIYFKRDASGRWVPEEFDHPEAALAARELGVEKIPVALVRRRPFKSTGFMKGEFEFTEREKDLAKQQERIMARQGADVKQSGNVIEIDTKRQGLTPEEELLLDDRNIRESVLIDQVPDTERYTKGDEQWFFMAKKGKIKERAKQSAPKFKQAVKTSFKPRELIIPSSQQEQEWAEGIYTFITGKEPGEKRGKGR